jgi:hypothetical protein
MRSSFWRHWWNIARPALNGLWLVVSRRVMTFLIESNNELTQKNAWFRSFGQLTESRDCPMFRNGWRIIQLSSLVLLWPVWFRISHQGGVGRYWKDGCSTRKTHIRIIPGSLKNVSKDERLPHPAYSPDFAPSDFFRFGYLKGKMCDSHCESREDLLNTITDIFSQIHKAILISIFES